MPADAVFSSLDATRFLPEIILTIAGTLLMVLDPILHKRPTKPFEHMLPGCPNLQLF